MNRSSITPFKLTITVSSDHVQDDAKIPESEATKLACNTLYRGQYSIPFKKIRRFLFKNDKDVSSHGHYYSAGGSFGEIQYIFHVDTVESNKSEYSRRNRNSFVYGLNISTLVLTLICPLTKHFEIVRVPISKDKTTVGDLINLIPTYCLNDSLRRQQYRGICRASNGIEIQNRSFTLIGNVKKDCCKILAGELLVALPLSYSGTECMSLVYRIIEHPIVAPAFVTRKARVLRKGTSNIKFQKKNENENENENDSLGKIDEDKEIFSVVNKAENIDRHHISGSTIREFLLRSIHSAKTA